MTTRETLEKDFDEKFDVENFWDYETFNNCLCEDPKEIKSFFFEQMIPKVLEEIIPKENEHSQYWELNWYDCVKTIKQNAKEKFNINL